MPLASQDLYRPHYQPHLVPDGRDGAPPPSDSRAEGAPHPRSSAAAPLNIGHRRRGVPTNYHEVLSRHLRGKLPTARITNLTSFRG